MDPNISIPPPPLTSGPPPMGSPSGPSDPCRGPPGPPLVTPGWNDPPEFSPNVSAFSGASKRRILNKRVAFPLTPSAPSEHGDACSSIKILQEVIDDITFAVNQLPGNNVLKDMDRLSSNWNEPSCSEEIKSLLHGASKHLRQHNIAEAECLHKQLSAIPAAGWFTLFLHSIITLLASQSQR